MGVKGMKRKTLNPVYGILALIPLIDPDVLCLVDHANAALGLRTSPVAEIQTGNHQNPMKCRILGK